MTSSWQLPSLTPSSPAHSSASRAPRLLGDHTALGSPLPSTSTEVLSLELGLMDTCVCLALIFLFSGKGFTKISPQKTFPSQTAV